MQRLIILFIICAISQIAIAQQNNAGIRPCRSPECSQFDFWLGDWDLTWGDTSKGSNSIKKLMDGCVINENFKDPAAKYDGMSWSMFNQKTMEWQQTWVDNQGGYITLTGKFVNDEMILSTQPLVSPKGKKVVSRMVFYHIKPDSFDWNWESSTDDSKTWKLNWQIHYQRKK